MADIKADPPAELPENFTGWDPPSVEDRVVAAARRQGVDEHLARAVARNESSFRPDAVGKTVNGQNARGVMQLMPGTAKDMGVTDPMDADQSIEGGVKYLSQLQKKYGNDWTRVAQAYHAGPGNVDKGIIGPETNKYVAKVMKDREGFAGGGPPLELPEDFQGWDKPAQLKTTPAPGGQTSFIKPDLDPANQALRNTGLQVRKPRGPDLPEGLKPDNPNAYAPSGLKWALPAGKEIETGVATMSDPSMERKAQGLHQVVSGASQLAAPAVLAGVGAPVAVATRLGAAMAAQKGVEKGGEKLGVPEGYRNLAGDLTGAVVGGVGPERMGRTVAGAVRGATRSAVNANKWAPGAIAGYGIDKLLGGTGKVGAEIGGGFPIVRGAFTEAIKGWKGPQPPAAPTPAAALPTRVPRPLVPKEPTRAEAALRTGEAIARDVKSGTSLQGQGSSLPSPPVASTPPAPAAGRSVWGTPILQDLNSPPPEPTPQPNGTVGPTIAGQPSTPGAGPTWAPAPPPVTPKPAPTPPPGPSPTWRAAAPPAPPPVPASFPSTNRVPGPPPAAAPAPKPGPSPTWTLGTGPKPTEAAPAPKVSTNRAVEAKPTVEKTVEKPDAAAAAKALADEMGVTKIEPNTPPRSRPDKRAITTVNQLNSQMKAAAKQDPGKMQGYKHMTVEEFNKLPPKEQKAIRDRMKELPKLGLGGVIQTVSAQKPQVRRSRRGVAYGPPSLMRGMNPPPVPRRKYENIYY